MEKSSIGKKANQVFQLVLGLFIIGSGCSLFINSNLGSDPFNLASQGLSKVIHLQVGTTNMLIQLSILLLILFIDRKRIGLGTAVSVVMIGMVINFWTMIFTTWISLDHLILRIFCVCVAPVIIGFGVAFEQIADLGMVPNDIFPLVLYQRMGKAEFRYVRIGYDFVQFLIGVALGGVFGLGTIASVLITGPSIQFALKILQKEEKVSVEKASQ